MGAAALSAASTALAAKSDAAHETAARKRCREVMGWGGPAPGRPAGTGKGLGRDIPAPAEKASLMGLRTPAKPSPRPAVTGSPALIPANTHSGQARATKAEL